MNVTFDGLVMQLGSMRTAIGDLRLCLRWHGWIVYEQRGNEFVAVTAHTSEM